MSNKRSIQYIINIIVFITCGIFAFMANNSRELLIKARSDLPKTIETEWRQQAKRTLSMTTTQFNTDLLNSVVNSDDNASLQEWSKRNISGLRNGGLTGDGLMIRIYYENGKLVGKFIWDGSPDCAKPSFIINGRYLTDEAEMHYDPIQAQYIITQMLLGQSTLNTNKNYWWNFDGKPEYLEWDVIPSGVLGFSEEPLTIGGVNNEKYNKILICLGTQEDEVQSNFESEFNVLDSAIIQSTAVMLGCIIISLFNLIIYIYLSKKMRYLS